MRATRAMVSPEEEQDTGTWPRQCHAVTHFRLGRDWPRRRLAAGCRGGGHPACPLARASERVRAGRVPCLERVLQAWRLPQRSSTPPHDIEAEKGAHKDSGEDRVKGRAKVAPPLACCQLSAAGCSLQAEQGAPPCTRGTGCLFYRGRVAKTSSMRTESAFLPAVRTL